MDLPIDIMSEDEDNDSPVGSDSVFKKPTQVGNSEAKLLNTDASDGVPLSVPKSGPSNQPFWLSWKEQHLKILRTTQVLWEDYGLMARTLFLISMAKDTLVHYALLCLA